MTDLHKVLNFTEDKELINSLNFFSNVLQTLNCVEIDWPSELSSLPTTSIVWFSAEMFVKKTSYLESKTFGFIWSKPTLQ